jgi:hypothetical protein
VPIFEVSKIPFKMKCKRYAYAVLGKTTTMEMQFSLKSIFEKKMRSVL